MVGMLLGSLSGGAISDRYGAQTPAITKAVLSGCSPPVGHRCVPVCLSRYGKRPMLLACLCVHGVCGLVPAVLPQPLLFLAVRCLTGVCCCCINISSFSLGNETRTPPNIIGANSGVKGHGRNVELKRLRTHLQISTLAPRLKSKMCEIKSFSKSLSVSSSLFVRRVLTDKLEGRDKAA